jgi:hypothetical protein
VLGNAAPAHSQTNSVSALDDATTGTELDPYDRSDETVHAAAVPQCQDGAGSREQCVLSTGAEARQPLAMPDQRRSDVAAELDGHVASIRDGDQHIPRVAPAVDAKTAQCEAAHNAPRHYNSDADPEADLHVDATAAQRACRQ